jgi:hypothetical protein
MKSRVGFDRASRRSVQVCWEGEKDLDDLGGEQSLGAADERPIHKLAENLPHYVKIEQVWIGWLP